MKFYEFLEKKPAIPKLVLIEGVERLFADHALEAIEERLLAPAERALNVERFNATNSEAFGRLEAAVCAMPFLAATRLTIVRGAQELRVQQRRDLVAVAQRVPDGNVLVVEDLLAPTSKRPEPPAKQLAAHALRIDVSPTADARERFVREAAAELGVKIEAAAVTALVKNSDADLVAVRTDLGKLALRGDKITLAVLLGESLSSADAKAYQFAGALLEGRRKEALAIAFELLDADPRGAAIPLISALANEYALVWELAREGGELPSRFRWRERSLRPIAKRMGARRACRGFERAVRCFEAIVTGRADDPRTVLALLTAAGAPNGA
jgi:DNA polymerase III delta subunit